MLRNNRTHGFSAHARRAFTLVELMLVISIIALLTALLVAGAMKFKDAARTNAVDAQVTKYQRALETEYNLVVQQCHKEGPPAAVVAFCDGDVNRARAVHLAATLRINFPESFAEATTSFSIPTSGGYRYSAKNTFASVIGATAPTADRKPPIAGSDYERAALLYLIIKEKATAGTGADTEGTGEQSTETFGSKSLSFFVDSYGSPVIFYRWARDGVNNELNQPPYTAQSPVSRDPLDPKGLVASWNNATNLATLTSLGLGFSGKNRVPCVLSFGKGKGNDYFVPEGGLLPDTDDPVPGPYQPGARSDGDDRVGFRLSRFGAQGDGQ